MAQLKPGDQAPAFSLPDQDGNTIALDQMQGKKVLVYFYPKADTPGCTKQACSIRDSSGDLISRNIVALGISPDQPGAQKKFDDKFDLSFPLLSDPDHAVAQAYGAWGEKNRQGTVSMGIVRSSFLIDEQGRVEQTWYGIDPLNTVPNALSAV